jgi:hypothetical protein
MGSHGGATADGQVAMLAQLGVTDTYVKAPILSSMEVDEIGHTVYISEDHCRCRPGSIKEGIDRMRGGNGPA